MINSSKELEMVPLTLLLMTKKRLFMKGAQLEWLSMKGNLLSTKNPDFPKIKSVPLPRAISGKSWEYPYIRSNGTFRP